MKEYTMELKKAGGLPTGFFAHMIYRSHKRKYQNFAALRIESGDSMGLPEKDIMDILNIPAFNQTAGIGKLALTQFYAVSALLITRGIPFDTQYTNGTRRDAPTLEMTIHMNPNTTLVYSFTG